MNLLDKFIGAVSPKWALSRQQYRDIYAAYRGGVGTRLSTTWSRNQSFTGGRQGDRANLGSMRDRARRVYQENAIGRSILNTETDNVVADGLNLQGRTSDPAFNGEVEARYHEWLKVCDISGMRDGIELQREAYRMSRRDGDGGIVLVDRGGHSRLQLIPGDLVQNPDGQWDPNYKDGVEIDRVGRPIAFHVLEQDEIGTRTFQRIGAGSFVFLSHYPETMITRGESCYATVFPLLDQLDAYVDAVVIAARMGAVFGLLFKSETAGKQHSSLPMMTNSQGEQQKGVTLENGMIRYLGAGDDVVQVNPSQPMANTPDFVRCILRLIGLPFDMPLELVLRDVSQSNLSSLRGALQDFRRACRIRRRAYAAHWSRIYLWWLEREIKSGAFKTPIPADWHKHELHARGWEFTDPVTDVQAAMMACEFGFDSPQNVMAQLGRDPEDMFRQNKEWRDKRTELKLPDARSTMTRDPMPPPAPPAPPGGPGGMPPKPPGVAPGGPAKQITASDCGTGDGGFKPGNDCASGDGAPRFDTPEAWTAEMPTDAKQAFQEWTGDAFYKGIREYQKTGNASNPQVKAYADAIDKYLRTGPTYKGSELYRGMAAVDGESLSKLTKPGTTFSLEAASSFSTRQLPAEYFATSTGKKSQPFVLMRASGNKSGVDISALSKNKGESEVMAPKGTSYKVSKVTEHEIEDDDGNWHKGYLVDVEEVPARRARSAFVLRIRGQSPGQSRYVDDGAAFVSFSAGDAQPKKQIRAAAGDNCGTGDGGFKPGNDCGGGGGNPYDANAPFGPLPRSQKMRRSTWEASQWYDDEADADLDIADISPAAQAKRQQAAKRALREYVAATKDADEGFFVKKKAREIADHVANAERKIHTFRGNRHLDKGFDEAQRVAKAEIDGPMRKQAEKAAQILRSNFDMTPREAWDEAGKKVEGAAVVVIRAAGENCGTGDGGFKPGNDCAAGGGADASHSRITKAIDPENQDDLEAALKEAEELPTPEVRKLAEKFGVVGKPSKKEALRQIREVAENQAEAAARVQTMRDDRGMGAIPKVEKSGDASFNTNAPDTSQIRRGGNAGIATDERNADEARSRIETMREERERNQ